MAVADGTCSASHPIPPEEYELAFIRSPLWMGAMIATGLRLPVSCWSTPRCALANIRGNEMLRDSQLRAVSDSEARSVSRTVSVGCRAQLTLIIRLNAMAEMTFKALESLISILCLAEVAPEVPSLTCQLQCISSSVLPSLPTIRYTMFCLGHVPATDVAFDSLPATIS